LEILSHTRVTPDEAEGRVPSSIITFLWTDDLASCSIDKRPLIWGLDTISSDPPRPRLHHQSVAPSEPGLGGRERQKPAVPGFAPSLPEVAIEPASQPVISRTATGGIFAAKIPITKNLGAFRSQDLEGGTDTRARNRKSCPILGICWLHHHERVFQQHSRVQLFSWHSGRWDVVRFRQLKGRHSPSSIWILEKSLPPHSADRSSSPSFSQTEDLCLERFYSRSSEYMVISHPSSP
jgi:hypothetical protein